MHFQEKLIRSLTFTDTVTVRIFSNESKEAATVVQYKHSRI